MPPSAPRPRPCAKKNMASGKPTAGLTWCGWWSRWPPACTWPGCSAMNTWWEPAPPAPACTPPCWPRSRWARFLFRCTRTPWGPNACSRSTMPKCAFAWWKIRSRWTSCWRSASSAPRFRTSTLTTRAACARPGADVDKLASSEEVLAYLPPAWIGQNIFSYAQWLACGYVVNCPESASTVTIDLKEVGPTYYFAPPRIFEGLLTSVMIRMEDAGTIKRAMFHACMSVAKRVGPALMDGEPVGTLDRIKYALGNLLVYGPLRNNLGFSRVRVAYTAGEAIGPDLFTFYRSIGINLKQLYGSTETAVFVCLQPDNQARADTVGVPIRGVEIKVADNGEILVKSAGLLKEYYKNPKATAEVLTADGWYHTSDAGFLDAHGHIKIIDRVKDVGRIKGGANDGGMFAPKYVENKLKFFPHIKEVVALGDGREKVCVMVNIDFDAVGNWAERRNLPYAGYTDLAQKPEVYELIRECIEKVNADLATDTMLAGSQVSRFLVLHKELDADDGELTRTNKVRRGFIAEKYAV